MSFLVRGSTAMTSLGRFTNPSAAGQVSGGPDPPVGGRAGRPYAEMTGWFAGGRIRQLADLRFAPVRQGPDFRYAPTLGS